jgi:hypothetical protein
MLTIICCIKLMPNAAKQKVTIKHTDHSNPTMADHRASSYSHYTEVVSENGYRRHSRRVQLQQIGISLIHTFCEDSSARALDES